MDVEYLDYLGSKLVVSFYCSIMGVEDDEIRYAEVCTIANGCEFFSGVAILHPYEHLDIKTGRRIAFSRAAKAYAWNRVERWNDYCMAGDWEGAKKLAKWICSELRLARYNAKTAISDGQ